MWKVLSNPREEFEEKHGNCKTPTITWKLGASGKNGASERPRRRYKLARAVSQRLHPADTGGSGNNAIEFVPDREACTPTAPGAQHRMGERTG